MSETAEAPNVATEAAPQILSAAALIAAYTPRDWYWLKDDGTLYGSGAQSLIASDDAGFVAWTQGGARKPTRWPSDAEGEQTTASLQQVLAPLGLSVELEDLKKQLKKRVDDRAEELRLTLITPGSGQAMEYQESYAQAQAALAVGDAAQASDYPMLAVTIGVDIDPQTHKPATDVLGVARSVKAAYEAYLQAGAAIRGARLLAKAEIDAAGDADHARAVFAAVKWPTFG